MRMFLFAGVGLAIFLLFKRVFAPSGRIKNGEEVDERLGRLVQDPNCGVYVDNQEAVRVKVPDGELFFCSKECANTYMKKPGEEA